jgi:glutamyl-tRNA reductase
VPNDLFVVGLSWRTAQVSLRERLAFHDEELEGTLRDLLQLDGVSEALVLSTCNRVEVYGCTSKAAPSSIATTAAAEVRSMLSRSRKVSAEDLAEALYEHTEGDAVQHIFRVAAALDSMVVGESQILGQLKAAYGEASRVEATGQVLGRCVETAFRVAKRVRTETGISRGAANVSSVAVELAKRVFGDLSGKTVLVVGAGKMSALAARHLRADGAGMLVVTNRSPDKAEALAAELDGVARPWESLADHIARADVLISSTGAREPVLTKKMFKSIMRKRRYQPLVVVDIAVPRDAESSIGKLEGVYLFDIDDLEQMVAENLKERSKEAEAATSIVVSEVKDFQNWLQQQRVVPTIRALREHFHEVANLEVERALKNLSTAQNDKEREAAVRRLGQLIANKLLHAPMTALKSKGEIEQLVDVTHQLFGLFEEESEEQPAPPLEGLEQKKG